LEPQKRQLPDTDLDKNEAAPVDSSDYWVTVDSRYNILDKTLFWLAEALILVILHSI
jgi:hypothetical protein